VLTSSESQTRVSLDKKFKALCIYNWCVPLCCIPTGFYIRTNICAKPISSRHVFGQSMSALVEGLDDDTLNIKGTKKNVVKVVKKRKPVEDRETRRTKSCRKKDNGVNDGTDISAALDQNSSTNTFQGSIIPAYVTAQNISQDAATQEFKQALQDAMAVCEVFHDTLRKIYRRVEPLEVV
jgi:hypothetical protein